MKRNTPCVVVAELPFKAPAGHTQFHRNAERQIVGMSFGCPCGCGAHHGARFSGPNAWGFDGNETSPTVTGSFGCHAKTPSEIGPDGRYHWHGHLVAGEYQEC